MYFHLFFAFGLVQDGLSDPEGTGRDLHEFVHSDPLVRSSLTPGTASMELFLMAWISPPSFGKGWSSDFYGSRQPVHMYPLLPLRARFVRTFVPGLQGRGLLPSVVAPCPACLGSSGFPDPFQDLFPILLKYAGRRFSPLGPSPGGLPSASPS